MSRLSVMGISLQVETLEVCVFFAFHRTVESYDLSRRRELVLIKVPNGVR